MSERLCIIAPDSFYAALLKSVSFPTFETLVTKGLEDLYPMAEDFIPGAFLLFASQLGPVSCTKLRIEIRHKFPATQIFEIQGVQQPTLHMIWPTPKTLWQTSGLDASSVDLIDSAMRQLSKPELVSGESTPKLTKSQLGVIRDLASGLSSVEMATSRNTSLRAVEMLIIRALNQIGLTGGANSRKKVILAQKYLLTMGDDSFWEQELSH